MAESSEPQSFGLDFAVVGVQKAASTSLDALFRNLGVALPRQKETDFFANPEKWAKGIDWYEAQFEPVAATELVAEVEPDYFFHAHSAERLHATYPNCKLVVVLREPKSRAYSQYQMSVERGLEKREFNDALSQNATQLDGPADWQQRQHTQYLSRSLYAPQVRTWLRYFPAEQFCFVLYEDLVDSQKGPATLNRIGSFVGIDLSTSDLPRREPVGAARSKAIARYGFSGAPNALKPLVRKILTPERRALLGRWLRRNNDAGQRVTAKFEDLPDPLPTAADQLLAADADELASLLPQLDLRSWERDR